MDVFEFCEWLYKYLTSHDSDFVSKRVILEQLNNAKWIRLK